VGDWRVSSLDYFHDERPLVLGVEGVFIRAQLVEHAAERPDIALMIVGFLLA